MTNANTKSINDNTSNAESHSSAKHYDVIISGGGLSGCLTALSLLQKAKLQNRTLSIAIVEANAEANSTAQNITQHSQLSSNAFDARVIALSHQTASYFKTLNIWQYLSAQATPIQTIHVSDRSYYGKARIYAHEYAVDALGYAAKMTNIASSIKQGISQLLKEDNTSLRVDWYCPDTITKINWQTDLVQVQLSANNALSANLLLACDGAKSVCRKFAGINSHEKTYPQSAIIANVRMAGLQLSNNTTATPENIAYERFTEFGPIAMLPLGDNLYALAWTLTPEQAQKIAHYTDNEFIQAINKAFGLWQGGVVETGKRSIFPLSLVQAESNVYHRMALVGNASHTIHPIAGQGFNLGVRDIQKLSDLISQQFNDSSNAKADLGNYTMLSAYEQHRKNDQQQVISMTDTLVKSFSNNHIPFVVGRNIALKAMNYITPIKKRFVKKSMGY